MSAQIFIPGKVIFFDLETWPEDEMVMKEFKAEILHLIIDPLGRHESKCMVMVDDKKYGIPFNRIKKVMPAYGEQMTLF